MKAPVNTKSLFHFITDKMEKLDNNEITIEHAKAQANLARQANNLLRYELERANLKMELTEFNIQNKTMIELREIESKSFDNTISE